MHCCSLNFDAQCLVLFKMLQVVLVSGFYPFLFVWFSSKNVLNITSSFFRCSPHLFVVRAKLLEDLQGVNCKNQASFGLGLWVIDNLKVS